MRRATIMFAAMLAMILVSCDNESRVKGAWKVTNVNINFDEYKNTPDMIKQIGLSEKSNMIVFDSDTTFIYICGNDTVSGKMQRQDRRLFVEGREMAYMEGDTIVEKKNSVVGDLLIKYVKCDE